MLYSRAQLLNLSDTEAGIAIQRYLNKIFQKETRKLLPHECDYLGIRLRSIFKFDENGQRLHERAFEPYTLPFLSEVVFKYLIYVYFQNLDFLEPVYNGLKYLTKEEIAIDKKKFQESLTEWRIQLAEKKCDQYLHEVKIEYHRKLEILNRLKAQGAFGYFSYLRKCMEQELLAFYVYVTVKMFFKDLKSSHVEFAYENHRFVINTYTYVHILSRHYMPMFNGIDTERSFNDALPFIEPFILPTSLAELLAAYFGHAPAEYILNEEYLMFDYRGDHYIIWWKYKKVVEIGGHVAFELRTLYKIHSLTDLSLRTGKVIIKIDDALNFYY
jgi:hypothetical protein